jgi:dsDNA-specific endonuclease/ATPase MutS2
MRYELKIDEFYMMDAVNYVTNEYFDEKALIYNITEEHLMAEIENVAHEVQMQFVKQKQRIDQPTPKPAKKIPENDTEEIDLHIEQLVDNPKTLTPVEMLDIQMQRFSSTLEEATRNRRKRIVFIHGVGNGRLRLEIQRTLKQKYPKLRHQDASFKEYGFGATMVFLNNN